MKLKKTHPILFSGQHKNWHTFFFYVWASLIYLVCDFGGLRYALIGVSAYLIARPQRIWQFGDCHTLPHVHGWKVVSRCPSKPQPTLHHLQWRSSFSVNALCRRQSAALTFHHVNRGPLSVLNLKGISWKPGLAAFTYTMAHKGAYVLFHPH